MVTKENINILVVGAIASSEKTKTLNFVLLFDCILAKVRN